jgi:uncharacterized BrkB/YihY/UPF0761 family membrane protein
MFFGDLAMLLIFIYFCAMFFWIQAKVWTIIESHNTEIYTDEQHGHHHKHNTEIYKDGQHGHHQKT